MKIKLLYEDAYAPTRGSEQAAGLDLYAYDDIDKEHEFLIRPGEMLKINTGIAIALDPGTAALILPRSGLATKKGLRPANTPGLIDADYRGPVIVALRNDSKATRSPSIKALLLTGAFPKIRSTELNVELSIRAIPIAQPHD